VTPRKDADPQPQHAPPPDDYGPEDETLDDIADPHPDDEGEE